MKTKNQKKNYKTELLEDLENLKCALKDNILVASIANTKLISKHNKIIWFLWSGEYPWFVHLKEQKGISISNVYWYTVKAAQSF